MSHGPLSTSAAAFRCSPSLAFMSVISNSADRQSPSLHHPSLSRSFSVCSFNLSIADDDECSLVGGGRPFVKENIRTRWRDSARWAWCCPSICLLFLLCYFYALCIMCHTMAILLAIFFLLPSTFYIYVCNLFYFFRYSNLITNFYSFIIYF